MSIFIIFVSIVLLSLVLQWLSKSWLIATGVPCSIFSLLIFSGALFPNHTFPAFALGMPMVFFASLLGSYVYETRLNPERSSNSNDTEHNEKVDDSNEKTID